MIKQWYALNIALLNRAFGELTVERGFNWILIHKFNLPPVWNRKYTALLIKIPGKNIENHAGYNFYIDLGLIRTDGLDPCHIYERSSYNDLFGKKYARLCLHLKHFKPSMNMTYGDTIVDICEVAYNFLGQRNGV
jgi:hypothetical protein